MSVHHEGDDDIGALEEVDVGDSYNTAIKNDDFESEQKQRRPSVGPRNRCPYGCGKMIAARTIDYHRTNGCRPNQEEPFGLNLNIIFLNVSILIFLTITRETTFMHYRSGFVNSNSVSGDPARDRTGPFRIGYTCTAYIHGTHHADGVTIEMCGDHYGHDARMRLPQVVKYIIAQKQMEGEHNVDIVDYLRRHFMPFVMENIYAQRICLVDLEELRTLSVTSTKKWELLGIPSDCEIWEEELLDRAGIVREGVPRLRQLHEKTTQQIAEEENWPRPRVFTAKIRLPNGEFAPIENNARLNGEDEMNTTASRRRIVSNLNSQCPSLGGSFMDSSAFDGAVSFVDIETKRKRLNSDGDNMANGVDEDHTSLLDDLNHARDEFVDVESTTESNKNNSHNPFSKIGNGVEGEILKGVSPSKQFILNQLLSEVDIFKAHIKNSSSSMPTRALQSLLLRMKSLRTSLDHPPSQAFRGSSYRPGRIIMPSLQPASSTAVDGETSRAVYSIAGSDDGRFPRQSNANVKRVPFEEVIEGTLGADKRNAVNTKEAYSRFPTPQTLKELFGGIPYNELPIVYVKATKNNTLVTVTDHKNNVITYTSCRLEGFVNARKKTTIAGQTTGVAAGQRLMRRGIGTVRVQVKGLGPGRITCIKGLTVAGVNVVSITDHTPVPELGPRPRKIRRV
uniref:SET domain-containing protein n=1 Tax=Heterorhabditis bacteriophora TaxID=37862 RepID=A0A1I7XM20_HETBA